RRRAAGQHGTVTPSARGAAERLRRQYVRQVREPLGEVADQPLPPGVVLFREEPEVVGRGRRAVEDRLRLTGSSLTREALGEPERRRDERSLPAGRIPAGPEAVQETIHLEVLTDRV